MNPPAGWHPDPYDPSIERYWDGLQWTDRTRPRGGEAPTQVFGPVGSGGDPASGDAKKRRKWPWVVGAGFVGLLALGAAVGEEEPKDPSSAVTTSTSSAAPATATTSAPPATSAPVPSVTATAGVETATTYIPTSESVPAPTTTVSLEYSCSDAKWRESMGADGDALCGSPWTPRNQSQAPAYTPTPMPEYTPPPTTRYTPLPVPQQPVVSYENCAEAKAAGVAPILRGEPGYAPHLDRDKDGIACDK